MIPTDPSDAHLLRCWRHQDCKGCLDESHCSWCPFSWACVPNNYTVPALAPAYDEGICPHWAERWEIRTRPLGCQVSTITSLTSLVSIASTIALALIIVIWLFCFRRIRRYHQQQPAGWWRFWEWNWKPRTGGIWFRSSDRDADAAEQEPILGRSSSSSPSRSRSR